MTNSITDWKNCLYGGAPDGKFRGHRVEAHKMTTMVRNKTTVIHLCVDCKAKKIEENQPERK